jgi:hypothetical protein
VSEAGKLREKASHAREVAWALTDEHARAALEALADELEVQAAELDRQEQNQGSQTHPTSQNDTP